MNFDRPKQNRYNLSPTSNELFDINLPMPPTEPLSSTQKFYDETKRIDNNISNLRNYAQKIKKDIDLGKYDAVEGLQRVSRRAADFANDDKAEFLSYLSETFIGTGSANNYVTKGANPPIYFGDSGFHPDYRDYSPQQSFHYQSLFDAANNYQAPLPSLGNFKHEVLDPIEGNWKSRVAKGSEADYDLSNAAIQAAENLRSGKWDIDQYVDNIPSILKNKSLAHPDNFFDTLNKLAIKISRHIVNYERNPKNSR